MDKAIRRQIAEWCNNVWAITRNEHISTSDAVEAAGVPEEWRTLMTCLLVSGYADMEEWVNAQSD